MEASPPDALPCFLKTTYCWKHPQDHSQKDQQTQRAPTISDIFILLVFLNVVEWELREYYTKEEADIKSANIMGEVRGDKRKSLTDNEKAVYATLVISCFTGCVGCFEVVI